MSRGTSTTLTIRKIDAMKAGEELWDSVIKGFHVRAGKDPGNGQPIGKSFLLFYTTASGIRRKPSIGKYGAITLAQAQETARLWLGMVAQGMDPMEVREQKKTEAPPPTLGDLKAKYDELAAQSIETYEARRREGGVWKRRGGVKRQALMDMKPSTIARNAHLWRHILETFPENKRLDSFTSQDVAALHAKTAEKKDRKGKGPKLGGAITANRTVSLLALVMRKASFSWKMVPRTVIDEITWELPQFPEMSRERFLTQEEGPRFFKAIQRWRQPLPRKPVGGGDRQREVVGRWRQSVARLALLCLFTGARLGEIMNARLSWIDWTEGKLLLLEHKTSSSSGAKFIPLPAEALSLLVERYNEWKDEGGNPEADWVIPGRDRKKPLQSPYKAWDALMKEAAITGLRFHDLRHSHATIGLSTGAASLDQIRQQLGHTSKTMTERYAHMTGAAQKQVIGDVAGKIMDFMKGNVEITNAVMPEDVRQHLEALRILENHEPGDAAH